jgi:hypothetical protein
VSDQPKGSLATRLSLGFVATALLVVPSALAVDPPSPWVSPALRHLSSAAGDLEAPNPGREQTASLVADLDRDGVSDFVIAERTQAPAVVWYLRGFGLHEARVADLDGDGRKDILAKPYTWRAPRVDLFLGR